MRYHTAYAYGAGAAEAGLAAGPGDVLRRRRPELVITTKGGLEQRGNVVVRHTGVSNFDVPQMTEFSAGGPVEVAQVPFSLLSRDVDRDILPYCGQQATGVMGWSALAHGLLTGALRPGQQFAPDDWRTYSPHFTGKRLVRLLEVVETLSARAAARGATVAQLALAWVLAHPAGVVPVIGAQLPEHVDDNVGAVEVQLTAADVAELEAVVVGAPSIEQEVVPPSRASSPAVAR